MPTRCIEQVAESWALAYADIRSSEAASAETLELDYQNGCPLCGEEEPCETHLVATLETGEGIAGGVLHEAWQAWIADTRDQVAAALPGRHPHPRWPSEVRSVYEALCRVPDLCRPENPDDPDAEVLMDDDAFHDNWLDCNGDGVLEQYLREWLSAQQEVIERDYEISSAPGLTKCGTTYFAPAPDLLLDRFRDCVRKGMFA